MFNYRTISDFHYIYSDRLYNVCDLILRSAKVLIIFSEGFPDVSLSSKTFRRNHSAETCCRFYIYILEHGAAPDPSQPLSGVHCIGNTCPEMAGVSPLLHRSGAGEHML